MALPRKLFATLDLPVLTALLRDARLQLVDIGGRGSAFYPLLTLAPFAEYFVFEPDDAEAERLTESLPREAPWRRVSVVRTAIASQAGVARLRVTAEAGMSSLLDPDPEVTRRFHLAPKFDVAATVDVATTSLDAAAASHGFTDAAFVKLDTQGTELDILQSGPRLVGGPLVGLYVEALFHPFYKGQSVFADVDTHLRGHGFSLCEMQRTMLRRAGYQKARYSKRTIAWAHCLYLREPAAVVAGGGADSPVRLARLLGLAVAFQHFDLALEAAALAGTTGLVPPEDAPRLRQEIESAADLSLRYLLRKREESAAAPYAPVDELTAATVRDKSQRE